MRLHDDFHDSTIGFQIFSCYYLDIECYSLLISHIPKSKINALCTNNIRLFAQTLIDLLQLQSEQVMLY